jgi:Uma2 family endonuclease
MIAQPQNSTLPELIYPESDGKPMADNTKQFRWIVTIKENLEILFADRQDVFVAGDLLWYPVEGNNRLTQAPDAMVVFGRPKGDRGSYQQWKEGNIAPQVAFEILSPSNTSTEMKRKRLFYAQYGVQEYYQYDPDKNIFLGYELVEGHLLKIAPINGWVSPKLGIRFECLEDTLVIYGPSGEKFLTPVELAEERNLALQRAERLAQKLKELGIDPDDI